MSLKKKEAVQEVPALKFGFEVTGLIKVFGKEREITLKNGKKTTILDNWANVSRKYGEAYVQKPIVVKFAEDYEAPKTTTDIIVKQGWLTLSGGEGYERITLFIKECEEA